jgi:hypothetical protein
MKKPGTSELIVGAIIAVIASSMTFLLGKANELLKPMSFTIGTALFAVIVLAIIVLVLMFVRAWEHETMNALTTSHREEVEHLIQGFRKLIPPIKHSWLLRDDDIERIEGEVSGKDIWIVSPDMHFDLIEKTFQNVTKKNFQKGITYTYIVPKTYQMQARINMLRRTYASYLSQVEIKELPEETFRQLAITHIDIYDPNAEDARVFLQLPIEERGYWIELTQDEAHGIIGRFRGFVDQDTVASGQK